MDIYYSRKLRRSLASSPISLPPGSAHYSYGHVADKFLNLFNEMGLVTVELERPEIYLRPPMSEEERAFHFIFKPYDEFRLLKRAFNIAHVAWEFEELPHRDAWAVGDQRRDDPFSDYVHMLSLPDRIWVGCVYSKAIFARYGINRVDVVPAPIETPRLGRNRLEEFRKAKARVTRKRLERVLAIPLTNSVLRDPAQLREHSVAAASLLQQKKNVFMLVANPGDLRKNLPALVDGFSIAAQSVSNAVLIVKLTIDNRTVTLADVLHNLRRLYLNEEMSLGDITPTNIYFISDFLDADQLQALYLSADFYLSSAVAEGQNLPLQESMAVGVIPVVANHTAMADYVDSLNAVLIDWRHRRATQSFERAYGLSNLRIPYVEARSVAKAVKQAVALSERDRIQKREAAARVISERYSMPAIGRRIDELLQRTK